MLNQNYMFMDRDSKQKYETLGGQIANNASVFTANLKDMRHMYTKH